MIYGEFRVCLENIVRLSMFFPFLRRTFRSHRVAPSSRDCNLFFHGRATVMGNNSSSSEKQAFLRMCELGKLKDIHDLWEVHRHETTNEKTKERFLSLADANGMTGLHLACEAGECGEAKVETTYVCFLGHTDIVKFLALGCSSLLDYVTIRGNTPLHIAARSNRPDCVKILLRAANQGSWEQCRLLWIALRKDRHTNPSCAFARFNKDEIRLLCQVG
jgi:ankyrin repeat protein